MKTEYVLGFLFKDSGSGVVLIRKNKPEWQKGLLNGIGGKIEPGETPASAMLREFEEEAGAVTVWQSFCKMIGKDWVVHCFKSFDSAAFESSATMTDEKVVKVLSNYLTEEYCVSNLFWLVELALDKNDGRPMFSTIQYDLAAE